MRLAALRRESHDQLRISRREAGKCEDCGGSGQLDVGGGYCGCSAGQERQQRDQQVQAAIFRKKVNAALAAGGVPSRYLPLSLDDWQERDAYGYSDAVLPLASEWLERCRNTGWWLVLSGKPCRGKTALAAACARKLLEDSWQRGSFAFKVNWVRPDPLQQRLQADNYRDEARVLAPLYAANSLLVVDDLGELAGPVDRKLALCLKYRFEQQLPTLLTTMLSFDDIELRYGGNTAAEGIGQAVGESISWRLAQATDDKRFFLALE